METNVTGSEPMTSNRKRSQDSSWTIARRRGGNSDRRRVRWIKVSCTLDLLNEEGMEDNDWARDPFGVFPTFLSLIAHKELTELKAAKSLKLKFREMSLGPFRLSVREEYSLVSETAVRILLSFSTIYEFMRTGGFNAHENKNPEDNATRNH
jgi:hypothetical protein